MSDDLIAWLRGVLDDEWPEQVLTVGDERTRADIAAKRAILDEHPPVDGLAWDAGGNEAHSGKVCGTCCSVDYRDTEQPLGDAYPCRTVRLLASAYAERPGYREEWAPDSSVASA